MLASSNQKKQPPNNTALAAFLLRAWMRRGWFAYCTLPVALLFGTLLQLRRWLYQLGWLAQHQLPVDVIVVGNIFIGGTGKTPFTIWLVKQCIAAGLKPAVISRGYGRQGDAPYLVTPDSSVSNSGDEPLLIAKNGACPVMVGRSRVAAGQALLAAHPEVNVIIADDGLQHLPLARQVEIILYDDRAVGNGWILPAGPLREPVRSAQKYPNDVTIVNLPASQSINPILPANAHRMQLLARVAVQLHNPLIQQNLIDINPSLSIVAAAGMGNPERFFAMLRQFGVQFTSLALPDHFDFATNPFEQIDADVILITEKDAVKCSQIKALAEDKRLWFVPVEAQLAEGTFEAILKKLPVKKNVKSFNEYLFFGENDGSPITRYFGVPHMQRSPNA